MNFPEISRTGVAASEPKPHGALYKVLIFLLIFTSGMGEVGAVYGIKPSYIAAFAVAVVFTVNKVRDFYVTRNKYYLAYLLFAFFWGLYALVQGAFVKDASLWFIYAKALFVNIFIIFVIIDYVRELSDVAFLIDCFTVYIAVCLIIGCFEIFADIHLVETRETSRWLPHTFHGNENDNAALLLFGVYAMLISIFTSKSTPKRVTLAIIIAVTVWQIIATKSRAAILAVIALVLIAPVFILLVLLARRSKKAYIIAIGSVATLTAAAILVVMLNYTLEEFVELFTTDGNRESDILRGNLIISGIRSIFDSYGLGIGAGQSILLHNINLHNFYLDIFAEYGVIIGGTFLFLLGAVMLDLKGSFGQGRFNVIVDGIIRSFPLVLAIAGIGPSSTVKLRGTWIIISIIFALKYVNEGQSFSFPVLQKHEDEL